MKRIGFFPPVDKSWMGGANYYKNLFYAIVNNDSKSLYQIYAFVGTKTCADLIDSCYKDSVVIRSSLFDRKSILWVISKLSCLFFKYDIVLHYLMRKYSIDIVSHSCPYLPSGVKKIGWIPDFQHVHLPYLFSKSERKKRDVFFKDIIKRSDAVLLSSNDALADYMNFSDYFFYEKSKVLRFVSQVGDGYFALNELDKNNLFEKYSINDEYYYIPNQFWKHKNHIVLFEAVKKLKEKGVSVQIVCSGHEYDPRFPGLYQEYNEFISSNDLNDEIKLIGGIPYSDVLALIKFSKAVINPSLFEGWSSTVEECKSAGKPMILSNIAVHIEQCPEAKFFVVDDSDSLVAAIESFSIYENFTVDDAVACNRERTKEYFHNYSRVISSIC
ncbi:glycosyltransferase [Amphritea pacifica]|uniref:glycosyltransferase n=1 Tax=Amphritea pacifica TaxID=2811233 RepID=UPI0019623DFE|nr:glycosyltransferase [Amphritea pacifica]MBN1005320.1 glycosyltransferase [Amphritea pacifica]